jgi:AraC-like DNA-binding protein
MPGVITAEINALIQQVLHNSLSPAEKNLFLEASIRNLLRLYLHEFISRNERLLISDPQTRLLKEVASYIESHLDKKLSVDVLASKFNISRSWLQQVSKNHYGKGIHRLVKQMRMEAATRLLLGTDHPVSSIVMMVSDMTFAAFSAAFHEYYGQSPLQYRKNRGQKP